MEPIHIYTDGACKGNPGMMGIGIIILPHPNNPKDLITISKPLGSGTNNIAELSAIDIALDELEKLQDPRPVALYSDSQYAINVLTRFKSVVNVQLIQKIKNKILLYEPGIKLIYVPGHRNNVYNNYADRLASTAALSGNLKNKINSDGN